MNRPSITAMVATEIKNTYPLTLDSPIPAAILIKRTKKMLNTKAIITITIRFLVNILARYVVCLNDNMETAKQITNTTRVDIPTPKYKTVNMLPKRNNNPVKVAEMFFKTLVFFLCSCFSPYF